MFRTILSGALVALLLGCNPGGVEGAGDFDSSACAVCPAQPDPVPCLRRGSSLAGDADRLLELMESGADATTVDDCVWELGREIDAWAECAESTALY